MFRGRILQEIGALNLKPNGGDWAGQGVSDTRGCGSREANRGLRIAEGSGARRQKKTGSSSQGVAERPGEFRLVRQAFPSVGRSPELGAAPYFTKFSKTGPPGATGVFPKGERTPRCLVFGLAARSHKARNVSPRFLSFVDRKLLFVWRRGGSFAMPGSAGYLRACWRRKLSRCWASFVRSRSPAAFFLERERSSPPGPYIPLTGRRWPCRRPAVQGRTSRAPTVRSARRPGHWFIRRVATRERGSCSCPSGESSQRWRWGAAI